MELIHTEIDLEADADDAWRVLIDFGAYPDWNPFVREIEGSPALGSSLKVRLKLAGGRQRTFRPTITKLTVGEELRWLGRLWLPGLLDGEHSFFLERFRPDRVRFFQREIFRGALAGRIRRDEERLTEAFTAMNQAFKARVERDYPVRRASSLRS